MCGFIQTLAEEGAIRVDPHENGYTVYWEEPDGKVKKIREILVKDKEVLLGF